MLSRCEDALREHEAARREESNVLLLVPPEAKPHQRAACADELRISNVVCTFTYCRPLGPSSARGNNKNNTNGEDDERVLTLTRLAMLSRGVLAYNPSSFAAAVCNFDEPTGSILLFQSGKAVVAGARDVLSAVLVARRFCHEMSLLGVRGGAVLGFAIQNLVAVASLQGVVDLLRLQNTYSAQVSYNPSLFPGARLRLHGLESSAGLSVFRNGSVVITGASDEAQLYITWYHMRALLLEFLDGNAPPQRSDDYFLDQTADRDEMLHGVSELLRSHESDAAMGAVATTHGGGANGQHEPDDASGDLLWLEQLCAETGLNPDRVEVMQ